MVFSEVWLIKCADSSLLQPNGLHWVERMTTPRWRPRVSSAPVGGSIRCSVYPEPVYDILWSTYKMSMASLREILSLAEEVAITTGKKKSVDYGVVRESWPWHFYRLGCAECDPADPLNTREAHCGKNEFSFQNIYLKIKISVSVCVCSIKWFYILIKFRCIEEARRINILIKKSRPTLTHLWSFLLIYTWRPRMWSCMVTFFPLCLLLRCGKFRKCWAWFVGPQLFSASTDLRHFQMTLNLKQHEILGICSVN